MDPGAHESQEAREKHAARLVRALMRLRQQEIRHDINFDGCLRFAGRGVRDQQFPKLASLKSVLARSLFSQAIRIHAARGF